MLYPAELRARAAVFAALRGVIDAYSGGVKRAIWLLAGPSATVRRMPSTSVPPPAIDALPRQAVRDPDYWLLVVAFLLLFVCGIQLLIFPFGRTQAAHALLGRAIVAGTMPVRDAWVSDAPGIGLLHAAIQMTLGRSMMAFRAIETIAVVGTVLAATRITKRWVGLERAGLLGGTVFILTYVQLEIDQTGRPEFFAGVLLLHALALCSRDPSPRSSKLGATLLGLFLGLTVLLVPSLWVALFPFFWWLLRRGKSQSQRIIAPWVLVGCITSGFVVPPLGLALWIMARGIGPAFLYDWFLPTARLGLSASVIEWASLFYKLTVDAVLRQSALLSAGLLATFTLGTIHEHERSGRRLLLSIAVFVMIGLVAQRDDAPGALAAVLPITSTIAGIGIYKAWRRMLTLGAAGTVAFSITAILLFQMCSPVNYPPGRFLRRSKVRLLYLANLAPYRSREILESELYNSKDYSLTASRSLAATLRERSLSNRDVWFEGDEPQLAWLLDGVHKGRFLRPIPAALARVAPRLKLSADEGLSRTQPEVLVVAEQAPDSGKSTDLPSRAPAEYALLETQETFRIYQRIHAVKKPIEDPEFCDPNN